MLITVCTLGPVPIIACSSSSCNQAKHIQAKPNRTSMYDRLLNFYCAFDRRCGRNNKPRNKSGISGCREAVVRSARSGRSVDTTLYTDIEHATSHLVMRCVCHRAAAAAANEHTHTDARTNTEVTSALQSPAGREKLIGIDAAEVRAA